MAYLSRKIIHILNVVQQGHYSKSNKAWQNMSSIRLKKGRIHGYLTKLKHCFRRYKIMYCHITIYDILAMWNYITSVDIDYVLFGVKTPLNIPTKSAIHDRISLYMPLSFSFESNAFLAKEIFFDICKTSFSYITGTCQVSPLTLDKSIEGYGLFYTRPIRPVRILL